jgi:hypothetical protein
MKLCNGARPLLVAILMALIASPRGVNQKSILQRPKSQDEAFAGKYKEQKPRQEKNKSLPYCSMF